MLAAPDSGSGARQCVDALLAGNSTTFFLDPVYDFNNRYFERISEEFLRKRSATSNQCPI